MKYADNVTELSVEVIDRNRSSRIAVTSPSGSSRNFKKRICCCNIHSIRGDNDIDFSPRFIALPCHIKNEFRHLFFFNILSIRS